MRLVGNFPFTKGKLFTENKFTADTLKLVCQRRRAWWRIQPMRGYLPTLQQVALHPCTHRQHYTDTVGIQKYSKSGAKAVVGIKKEPEGRQWAGFDQTYPNVPV